MYLWNPKYSFRHGWMDIYVYFLLKSNVHWPVFQLLPACKSLHWVMPFQHWTVYFMFIARGWVLNSLQGEYWKILSLGIGLANTPLLAGMDTKSIPVEWDGLTVLKSILPCRWWENDKCVHYCWKLDYQLAKNFVLSAPSNASCARGSGRWVGTEEQEKHTSKPCLQIFTHAWILPQPASRLMDLRAIHSSAFFWLNLKGSGGLGDREAELHMLCLPVQISAS